MASSVTPTPPMPAVCFAAVRASTRHGRGCVAIRDLHAGELVVFEAPLAVARVGEGESDTWPADPGWEWRLTRELVLAGCGRRWASAYCRDGGASDPLDGLKDGGGSHPNARYILDDAAAVAVDDAAAATMCDVSTAPTVADVMDVYRAVANNALLLETTVLRVTYGAAFYAFSSYLNHS